MRAALLLLAIATGCPGENRQAISEGYVHYEDLALMGPRIWDGRSVGRKGLGQTLATESHGFGAPGRVDVVVVEHGELDESLTSMVGDIALLRVDVSTPAPVVERVAIPVDRSDRLALSLGRDSTRVLHTGGDTSAIATGRMDGMLREGALVLYRGGTWDIYDLATYEIRAVDDELVVHTIEGLLLRQGESWTPVVGDVLGPADVDGFVTLEFEPGLARIRHLDWSGAVVQTVEAPVPADRVLSPLGVVDNGSPDDFVAVLSDCDVPIGELWRFAEGTFSPVRPSRLGPLQPGRGGGVHALDSFYSLPGEPSYREVRDGELAPWIESRTFWGHGDTWGCDAAAEGTEARCKGRPVTGGAVPDPSGAQIAMVTLDQTDSHPRIHLRQQSLPWQEDPTGEPGCDDSRCVHPDDPDNPNTQCARTTLDPTNTTCVPPDTVADGERFFNGLPFVEEPLSVRIETADPDDEAPWVDPHVCGLVSLVEPPEDYEAEVHGITRLDLSAPGYAPISVSSDPSWLDGETLILNRGQVVGPVDAEFYAYATPELLFVASENATWSFSTPLDEWRPVEGVDPALPLDMRTLGTSTLLRNIDGETWFMDGRTFRKLANYPIDFDRVAMASPEWWVSFDPGRGTVVHDRGTVRYIWSWTGAGPAIHHDVSPGGNTVTRILDDGSVVWHQNKPSDTQELLPAGWHEPGSRAWVMLRHNSVNPSPVVLVRPSAPVAEDVDCLATGGGCRLTYLYAGRETPLSTDAVAFAKHEEAAVWVDGKGVHRGTDGLVQTDGSLGIPNAAAGMLDLMASCTGTRCTVRRADAWPMTELISWDDGELKTVQSLDFRYFLFRSATRTIRYDRVTNDLIVLDGSSDSLMADGSTYRWSEGLGVIETRSDAEYIFARGDVTFPMADDLQYPACIPFSRTRFVDGEPDGRELLCATGPGG